MKILSVIFLILISYPDKVMADSFIMNIKLCDEATASPGDPNRKAPAVKLDVISWDAMRWCENAIDAAEKSEYPRLYYQLGRVQNMAFDQKGDKNFRDSAMGNYKVSADLGYAPAMHNLAFMYEDMNEISEAINWFQKAVDGGNVLSQVELERLKALPVSKSPKNMLDEDQKAQSLADQKTLSEYFSKNLSVSEQVFNYTSTGKETGITGDVLHEGAVFWSSVESCKFTRYVYDLDFSKTEARGITSILHDRAKVLELGVLVYSLKKTNVVDLNEINWKGLTIKPNTKKNLFDKYITVFDVTDGQITIPGAMNTSFERLKNGWGLVNKECPGKKTAF